MNYLPQIGNRFHSNNLYLHLPPTDISSSIEGKAHLNFNMNKNENRYDKNINHVWTKDSFDYCKNKKPALDLSLNLKPTKTTWTEEKMDMVEEGDSAEKIETNVASPTPSTPEMELSSPSHHARRPMNAFLIFCKKHRPIVRQKYPTLENRGVTRILGEWWALLDERDKFSYTNLAKEYKDAFFSANPDFKWYKLPAPPLRTLNTRPANVQRQVPPLSSPTQTSALTVEFTPGKLADESQLGSITRLMNVDNNYTKLQGNDELIAPIFNHKTDSIITNNNNIENSNDYKYSFTTPVTSNNAKADSLPPKPIKKRIFDQYNDNKNSSVARNIFDINTNTLPEDKDVETGSASNMKHQELLDKVVDSMFPQTVKRDTVKIGTPKKTADGRKQKLRETRKSGRLCKGRRYAEFMVEGKLLGNKRDKKLTQYKLEEISSNFENALNTKIESCFGNKAEHRTPKLDLEDTIKRLAERTQTKLEDLSSERENTDLYNGSHARSLSENSDDFIGKSAPSSYFDLDSRISELPCLSYEMFLQRKKDSKKRKMVRIRHDKGESRAKILKPAKLDGSLTGSKKRKNKQNITRLEKITGSNYASSFNSDLSGLATLAEIAAIKEKIDEK